MKPTKFDQALSRVLSMDQVDWSDALDGFVLVVMFMFMAFLLFGLE